MRNITFDIPGKHIFTFYAPLPAWPILCVCVVWVASCACWVRCVFSVLGPLCLWCVMLSVCVCVSVCWVRCVFCVLGPLCLFYVGSVVYFVLCVCWVRCVFRVFGPLCLFCVGSVVSFVCGVMFCAAGCWVPRVPCVLCHLL